MLFPVFLAGEDDYAIDIFSFGICALEVRETDGCCKNLSLSVFMYVNRLFVPLDGSAGDPGQRRHSGVQRGHRQCRSISRRPSHESECQKYFTS